MPPPFPLYLLISSAFATGFFVMLGAILTALVRWNTADPFSTAALAFYGAYLFTGVLRVIKDAWAYWPYAFHSGKFLRRSPDSAAAGQASERSWLQLSPGLAGAVLALLILAPGAYFAGDALRTAGASEPLYRFWREILFWLPGVAIIPFALFILMCGFGLLFVRSYAGFQGEPRPVQASRAVMSRWVLPEAFAFLILNVAILWPLGQAVFAVDAAKPSAVQASGFISGAFLVAFSTAALWLSIIAPATPALTGAVFSRLWRLDGIAGLIANRPVPEAGKLSFRFRDYFVPVFALNFAFFVIWRLGIAFAGAPLHSFAWFLIPAEVVWFVAFAYFRRRALFEDLRRVQVFYRDRPYFYTPGPASQPATLPAEIAA